MRSFSLLAALPYLQVEVLCIAIISTPTSANAAATIITTATATTTTTTTAAAAATIIITTTTPPAAAYTDLQQILRKVAGAHPMS